MTKLGPNGLVVVLALTASACGAPYIQVEALMEKARQNEVSAANSTSDRFVLVAGTVLDISFARQSELVTTGTAHRFGVVGRIQNRTQQQTRQVPYVALRATDATIVYCFLDADRLDEADRIEKGRPTKMSGGFLSFARTSTGELTVNLGGCRLE